jgi:hypothetical protein
LEVSQAIRLSSIMAKQGSQRTPVNYTDAAMTFRTEGQRLDIRSPLDIVIVDYVRGHQWRLNF